MFDPEYETTTVVVVLGEMAIPNFTPPKKKKPPTTVAVAAVVSWIIHVYIL